MKVGESQDLEKWALKLWVKMRENGISQGEVAKKMGISDAYLSIILNGHYKNMLNAKKKINDAIEAVLKERKQKG